MTPPKTLTRERLVELLDYDAVAGLFRWKISRGGKAYAGSIAGTNNSKGYVVVCIDCLRHMAHHLVWLMETGEFPAILLDHWDRDTKNNSFANLRLATKSQNAANTGPHFDSSSGLKGAYFHKPTGRWRSQIGFQGNVQYLGYFNSAEEASDAYNLRAAELFGQFAGAA